MNGIEYEIESSGGHIIKNAQWKESLEKLKNEEAVNFSIKVVEALEQKMQDHNSANDNKVSLKQLKKVYRRAAGNVFAEVPEVEQERGTWAMARVNMYLKLLQGEPFSSHTKAKTDLTLVEDVDLMDSLIPSPEDFILAKEDIFRFELNYKFENVNDLYLEDEEREMLGFYFLD
tara:strand:+ start:781 stop:1302 length:522 start_codon:yes stop_codon:yes gene_type:complete